MHTKIFIGWTGSIARVILLPVRFFPCHDSMLRISSWPAWLAFCSFLLTWVIYKCRTGELKAPAQLGWAGKRMTQHRITITIFYQGLYSFTSGRYHLARKSLSLIECLCLYMRTRKCILGEAEGLTRT